LRTVEARASPLVGEEWDEEKFATTNQIKGGNKYEDD